MSNMLRKGKRMAARKNKKVVKQSTKEFYKILGELDRVAEILKEDQTFQKEHFNEDDLVEYASKLTDIEIGGLEKMVLMGKLGMYESMEKQVQDGGQDTK